MRRPYATLLLVFLFAFSHTVLAQDEPGTIYGKIMGNLKQVQGAEITLWQDSSIMDKTITDEEGRYAFHELIKGHYDVQASKPGYRTTIITCIPVASRHDTRNDMYIGKFNHDHMPSDPIVQNFYRNADTYMRHNRSMTSQKPVKYPLHNERGHLPFVD